MGLATAEGLDDVRLRLDVAENILANQSMAIEHLAGRVLELETQERSEAETKRTALLINELLRLQEK